METVGYRSIEYIPLALLGIGLYDFFIIHIFTLAWGHYNHSNIQVKGWISGGILGLLIGVLIANSMLNINLFDDPSIVYKILIILGSTAVGSIILGPLMRYIFNSPEMHIWHHAEEMPADMKYGINFGITLAIWDYIFGTARIPHNGRDIKLGFPHMESFPKKFIRQNLYGFKKIKE